MNPLASRPSGAPGAQLEPRSPSSSGYERAAPSGRQAWSARYPATLRVLADIQLTRSARLKPRAASKARAAAADCP